MAATKRIARALAAALLCGAITIPAFAAEQPSINDLYCTFVGGGEEVTFTFSMDEPKDVHQTGYQDPSGKMTVYHGDQRPLWSKLQSERGGQNLYLASSPDRMIHLLCNTPRNGLIGCRAEFYITNRLRGDGTYVGYEADMPERATH
jgi:hypothetical protein